MNGSAYGSCFHGRGGSCCIFLPLHFSLTLLILSTIPRTSWHALEPARCSIMPKRRRRGSADLGRKSRRSGKSARPSKGTARLGGVTVNPVTPGPNANPPPSAGGPPSSRTGGTSSTSPTCRLELAHPSPTPTFRRRASPGSSPPRAATGSSKRE